MKKVKDTSFTKLSTMKKYEDIYDFSSLECRIALVTMIILDILFVLCSFNTGQDVVVNECINLLVNIGIALIGFLGFIVTGLAILTGAISSKIIKRLQDRNKINSLEKILLSFYLIGLIDAFLIVAIFIIYFLSILHIKSIFFINIIVFAVLSYFIIFTIFYAVKLIGNCFELFLIINNMQVIDEASNNIINYKERYNYYRITALEKIQLSNTSIDDLKSYERIIKQLIESDNLTENDKMALLRMHKKHFSK